MPEGKEDRDPAGFQSLVPVPVKDAHPERGPNHDDECPREKGKQAGLEIPSLTPRGEIPLGDGRIVESNVELTLTDVALPKLVDFLGALEQGPGVVRVTFLRLEPRPKDGVLTAWTKVTAYRLKAAP